MATLERLHCENQIQSIKASAVCKQNGFFGGYLD